MKLKFYRIRQEAKVPVRAHSIDAGMDLFYCPDKQSNDDCYWEPEGEYKIPPGESCLVPTGLKVSVPENYMLEGKNKSGIISFSVDGEEPYRVMSDLEANGINISVSAAGSTLLDMRQRGISKMNRLGLHYYNTEAELERFAECLAAI